MTAYLECPKCDGKLEKTWGKRAVCVVCNTEYMLLATTPLTQSINRRCFVCTKLFKSTHGTVKTCSKECRKINQHIHESRKYRERKKLGKQTSETSKLFRITYYTGYEDQTLLVYHDKFKDNIELQENILTMKCLSCKFVSNFRKEIK